MRFSLRAAIVACAISFIPSTSATVDCNLTSFGDFFVNSVATKSLPKWMFPRNIVDPLERNELGWLYRGSLSETTFTATKHSEGEYAYIIQLKGEAGQKLEKNEFTIHGGKNGSPFMVHCESCSTGAQQNQVAGKTCSIETATSEGKGDGQCVVFAGPGVVVLVPCGTSPHRLMKVDIIKA
ncbi:hypothetical protein BDZ94DRAFT_1326109 [Collybia nuda]|uniref:Uncharacterized protein n=1 Tax=Collybia nuda TaxID=64659 RepID=A0A9P5XY01_9AGAR|nr:hypothetical protein BDZ94DRAFT_1326109 [Collybia nuda]